MSVLLLAPLDQRSKTQYTIVEETEENHTTDGSLGFFSSLDKATEAAFGGHLEYDMVGRWEFPMGDLTVGQVLDFFDEHSTPPAVKWHNEGGHGPTAYIVIDDADIAEEFTIKFGIERLSEEEIQELDEEDAYRAKRG